MQSTETGAHIVCLDAGSVISTGVQKAKTCWGSFSVDCAFMTAEDLCEDMCPFLGGYDYSAAGIWALAVDKKGVSETVTKWINGKINEAGCAGTAIIIRSDQEEAIVALKKSIAIY